MTIKYNISGPDTPLKDREFGYPVRHRSKVPFSPEIDISPEVARWNIEIFRLDSELNRFILTADDYHDLISEAFASNIHQSTRMEGNPLTLREVRRLTRGTFRSGFPRERFDFPSQEIINHIGMYILNLEDRQWDEEFVGSIHKTLMSGDDASRPGMFRDKRSSVYSDEGEELFIPCPPEHIEKEVASLMNWCRSKSKSHYPVISGSILFHEFESIHPFMDGNGRTGRTLFHLYLQANGLPNSKLCFIEQETVSDLERYYELLGRADFYQDYQDLITHFTKAVRTSYEKAVERFKEKDLLSSDLDEMSKRILVRSREINSDFNLNEVRRWFENESDFKLRSRLRDLIERGAIWEHGETKAKRYRFADPMGPLQVSIDRILATFSRGQHGE
ncbi:MAG: Fic family protein [Thermoplasmata archaeon]|nr:Fic family protein [Thermoplasmata archaeon]